MNTCSASGKKYILLIFSIIFTCLLTALSITTKDEICIFINVVSIIYSTYLIYNDLFAPCVLDEICLSGCKWFEYSSKCKKITKQDIIYIFVFLLCSIYLLTIGIINLLYIIDIDQKVIDRNVIISISSTICGTIGILYIIADLLLCASCN